MPDIIANLLKANRFGYAARIVLTFMFWGSGLSKLLDFDAAKAEMAYFGLAPAAFYASVTIIVQLAGSAMIIANRWAWFGCGALAVFTALTIPVAHDFWAMQEPMRTFEFHIVVEHISIIGALMVVAVASVRQRNDRVSLAAALI